LSEHAVADAHPVRRIQHRKDQRRTKHRHKLQHRRKARQHTQRARKPESGELTAPIKGIQYTIGVRGVARTVVMYVHPHELDTGLKLFDWNIANPGQPITMRTSQGYAALWIDNRYFLEAVNYVPWPLDMKEWAWLGGRIDPQKGLVDGGLQFEGNLDPTTRTIDGSHSVIWDTNWVVHFLRRPDDTDFKRFEVLIQPNPY
jgi:hypothetical protein